MPWIESRLRLIEQRAEMLYRRLLDDEATLANVRQQLRGAYQQGGGGGGGGVTYFGGTTTGDLPGGSPGTALTGQTVWVLSNGARSNITNSATLYNDTPNDLPSGSQVILAANGDGTYSVIGKVC